MSTAHRILAALIVVPVVLLLTGVLFWYLAYGAEPSPPAEREIAALTQLSTVTWLPEETAHIDASNEVDFYRSLGYAHGVQRGWSAALWRQTGLGRVGHWFDEPALPLDSLTRQLGFSASAQAAFAELSEDEQELLNAYADGINTAFQNREATNATDFVLLGHTPQKWEPWHSLVVERLFAWLTAPKPAINDPNPPASVDSFVQANQLLRAWLQVDGFEHSTAWAATDTTGVTLFQRHVTGGSAPPLYHEIVWTIDDRTSMGAAVPGLPVFISGKTQTHAWAMLPQSEIAIQRSPHLPDEIETRHERLETSAGDEFLVTIEEGEHGLMLEPPPPVEEIWLNPFELTEDQPQDIFPSADGALADSTWFVQWSGFHVGSDFPAWRAVAEQDAGNFELITGDGLEIDSTGAWSVVGSPHFQSEITDGILVSQDDWGAYRADHLESIAEPAGRNTLPQIADHDSSTWAAEYAPQFLASLDSLEIRLDQSFAEGESVFAQAVVYLRNWNFSYGYENMGGTIFDRWMRAYLQGTGATLLRLTEEEQNIYFEDYRRLQSLRAAVDELHDLYGSDLEDWRWELPAQKTLHFPTWTPDTLEIRPANLLTRTRYAPINLPGRGHVSSLSWGRSLIMEHPPPPASWEAWVRTDQWDQFTVRRRHIPVQTPFGRYRHRDQRSSPVPLRRPSNDYPTTRLIPGQE